MFKNHLLLDALKNSKMILAKNIVSTTKTGNNANAPEICSSSIVFAYIITPNMTKVIGKEYAMYLIKLVGILETPLLFSSMLYLIIDSVKLN